MLARMHDRGLSAGDSSAWAMILCKAPGVRLSGAGTAACPPAAQNLLGRSGMQFATASRSNSQEPS